MLTLAFEHDSSIVQVIVLPSWTPMLSRWFNHDLRQHSMACPCGLTVVYEISPPLHLESRHIAFTEWIKQKTNKGLWTWITKSQLFTWNETRRSIMFVVDIDIENVAHWSLSFCWQYQHTVGKVYCKKL